MRSRRLPSKSSSGRDRHYPLKPSVRVLQPSGASLSNEYPPAWHRAIYEIASSLKKLPKAVFMNNSSVCR
jgi:hypothetical protein